MGVDDKLLTKRDTIIPFLIIGFLFFIFGFISWVNSILIPYFKIACELTNFQSYLVAFAFYIAYFIMSLPSSVILEKLGFKKGITVGFFIMTIGAFLFVPAALNRAYPIFLLGLFILGTGLALLQTAANPYITIVGPIEKAMQRLSIMGICNKVAGVFAPLVFAAVVLRVSDNVLFNALDSGLMNEIEKNAALDSLISRVIVPYSILGTFLALVGLLIYYSPLPDIDTAKANSEEKTDGIISKTSIFQFPYLILGAFAIFFHVGSVVIGINTIIGYANSMGINLLEAKVFPSFTLTATICGYLIGIVAIPRFVNQRKALLICTLLGTVLSLGILFVHGEVNLLGYRADISIWFLVALGFANSLIYGGIWPLAIRGLGRFTKRGSSLLIMALCGNAITPLIYGRLADIWDVQSAYVILLPCYLYPLFYALYGYKITSWLRTRK